MKYTHRFFIYAPFAMFLAVALGAGSYWWVTASAYAKRLDALNGHAIAPGVVMHFASKRIAGFPFRLDTVFRNFELDIAAPDGPIRWRTPHFAMHALTYGRVQTILESAGLQRFDWTGRDSKRHSFAFMPGAMHASAIDDDKGLTRFDLDIVGAGSSAMTVDHAQLHIRETPNGNGLDVFAEADGVRPAPRNRSALGDHLTLVRISGTAVPGTPFAGLRAGRAPWRDTLDAWRNAGGVFRIGEAEFKFPAFDAMGRGSFSLDASNRPNGLLDFKLAGFSRYVAQTRNVAEAKSGRAIADALLARAAKAGSNESGEMGVVVGIRDGIAYVGDTPVGMVPPLY